MPAVAAQTRPVDLVHLARYTDDDAALNAEILRLFLNQCAELMQQLHNALETHDQKIWQQITHSLKGAARGIGAFALADAAAAAEPLAVADDFAGAADALQTLDDRMRTVRQFIEGYLAD